MADFIELLMAHTFVSLNIHIIFSTKNRSPWMTSAIQEDIYSYIAIQGNKAGCKILAIGGIEDHVHILLSLHPSVSLSDWTRDIKIKSAIWIKKRTPQLTSFNWQRGFAAYSVSCQNIASIKSYITHQANHHKGMTCEEELEKIAENMISFAPLMTAHKLRLGDHTFLIDRQSTTRSHFMRYHGCTVV